MCCQNLLLIFGVPLLFFTPYHLPTQLVRFVLGDFDYASLDLYQPDNTSIYFMAYQFLVYIIIVNLFVAIVLNHFIFIHQNMDNPEHSWRDDTPSGVFKLFQKIWGKVYPCIKCFLCFVSDEKKAKWDSELEDLKREWHFEKWIAKAVWTAYARHGNSVDLMERFQLAYMKDLDLPGRDLYVNAKTMREWMGQDSVAKETKEDIAYQLIEAYLSIKVTIGLRPKKLLEGERYMSRSALSDLHYFEVLKYNRWGGASKRLLVVDSKTSTLSVYGETTFPIDTVISCCLYSIRARAGSRRMRVAGHVLNHCIRFLIYVYMGYGVSLLFRHCKFDAAGLPQQDQDQQHHAYPQVSFWVADV